MNTDRDTMLAALRALQGLRRVLKLEATKGVPTSVFRDADRKGLRAIRMLRATMRKPGASE